ncbi:MAG: GAF domain-containing protein [Oscillatoriales cyanobacterium SM2_2_1]|nr:GAF domain-containing protein [Oscillatoriales cyanobacterium SM2_2_1]
MLTASADLITLTRSQLMLLWQNLGADSSTLYLTEQTDQSPAPTLIEVVTVPTEVPLLSDGSPSAPLRYQGQVAIPLIYGDRVLGFLMTGRHDRPWTEQEETQVQQIAQTLAIACAFDRQLQWLQQGQQDFLATLLHQLRNPLTAIRTFGQLLAKRLRREAENHKLAEAIVRETWHMQELLGELDHPTPLLLPQSPLPQLPAASLECGAVALPQILPSLLATTEAIAQERGLGFESYIPAALPPALGNAAALREVFHNLLDNAVKYTQSGGIRIWADVSVRDDGEEQITVHIQDTGPGIAPQDLPHIFERRYRGELQQYTAGSGLGLAIAQDLVQQMGGTISVQSSKGAGSVFGVTLPVAVQCP